MACFRVMGIQFKFVVKVPATNGTANPLDCLIRSRAAGMRIGHWETGAQRDIFRNRRATWYFWARNLESWEVKAWA